MLQITAYCDSLCEPNPGAMEAGIWAKDDKENVLFMETISMGNGTCNEAEYRALLALIVKLRQLTEEKKVKPTITIFSDSQLMTKQLYQPAGPHDKTVPWKVSKANIKALYRKVRKFQEEYPFSLKWIPREQNSVADGLAQNRLLKCSSRSHMIEDGRFKARRYTPCVELLSDKAMARILFAPRLIAGRNRLLSLIKATEPAYPTILEEITAMLTAQEASAVKVPRINELADQWIGATFNLLRQKLEEMRDQALVQHPDLRHTIDDFFFSIKTQLSEEGDILTTTESEVLGEWPSEEDTEQEEMMELLSGDNRE